MRSSTWHALGNRYVVVETAGGRVDAEQARELSTGADGVVEVLEVGPDRVEVAIWNPDGTRAELSGNGTRIAAAWHNAESGVRELDVVVGGRTVRTTVGEDGIIEQDLGAVHVGAPETVAGVRLTPVSVGNPHAVVLGELEDIGRLGPLLATHPRFPDGTNVQLARVDAVGVVSARVWERGVGETASSGTSAVAVAAATHDDGDVLVRFPGGDLRVRLAGGRASLSGPAVRVD